MINATGIDYNAGPYSVTFPAGTTRRSLNVKITDDTLVERNEKFFLSIDQSLLPSNVSIDNHSRTTVTILDNDCKFYMSTKIS